MINLKSCFKSTGKLFFVNELERARVTFLPKIVENISLAIKLKKSSSKLSFILMTIQMISILEEFFFYLILLQTKSLKFFNNKFYTHLIFVHSSGSSNGFNHERLFFVTHLASKTSFKFQQNFCCVHIHFIVNYILFLTFLSTP